MTDQTEDQLYVFAVFFSTFLILEAVAYNIVLTLYKHDTITAFLSFSYSLNCPKVDEDMATCKFKVAASR